MIIPTTEILKNASKVLCPYLMDDVLYERMVQIVDVLPHFTHLGFECHLGERIPKAGLFFCFNKNEWSSRVFSGDYPDNPFPEHLSTIRQWQIIRSFFSEWNKKDSSFHKAFSYIYFEFDISTCKFDLPIPSIFFNIASGGDNASPSNTFVAVDGLQFLSGHKLSEQHLSRIISCIQALPSPGKLYAGGMMLSRATEGIRLCMSGLLLPQIMEFLDRVKWAGNLLMIQQTLEKVAAFTESYIVHIDVMSMNGISPTLGIECFPTRNRTPALSPNWEKFLDHLIKEGLCQSIERDCLISWPILLKTELISIILIFRRLNHVKLIFRADGGLEVKIYLSIAQEWAYSPFLNCEVRS